MKLEAVREIANAVLYEGYLLYPYRRSAIKNRVRWTFGVVYPREYSEAQGGTEPWTIQTECLVSGPQDATLDVTVRFLHLLMCTAAAQTPEEQETWEEGAEREVAGCALRLADLLQEPRLLGFAFPAGRTVERVEGAADITREQRPLYGSIAVGAQRLDADLFKLSVQIENLTPDTTGVTNRRDAVLSQSLVSTHIILQADGAQFISLLEPPDDLQALGKSCHNSGTWPVLVGEPGQRDTLLSSPIILHDYPQIAPESPGALFDGTEIDELLTLRILTLTDEEKAEMRHGDERAREILERTEALSQEQLMKMHGVIRSLRAAEEGEQHERR
jgi:hypothetical protein